MKKLVVALCISCASICYAAAQSENSRVTDMAKTAASTASQALSASSSAFVMKVVRNVVLYFHRQSSLPIC